VLLPGTFDPRSAARTCVFRIEQVGLALSKGLERLDTGMTPDLPKGFAVLLLDLLSAPISAAAQVRVTDELRRLAEIHGFTVSGLERTPAALG